MSIFINREKRFKREEARTRQLIAELQRTKELLKEAEDALLEMADIIGGEDGEDIPTED